MSKQILSVSTNTRLLVTRNDTLAIAGYTVVSPKTPEQAPALLASRHFDAIVIGHSVNKQRREEIIPALRTVNPNIPIIFVFATPDDGDEPLADFSVDVAEDPVHLVNVLEQRTKGSGVV